MSQPHPEQPAGRSGSLDRSALKEAAVTGVRWVALARLAGESIAFVSSVALARLVTPTEFGYAAVPLVMPMLAVILAFQGFGAVLVQRERVTDDEERTAEALSLAFGFGMSLLIAATSPLWAEPLFGEQTAALIRLAAPVFAIASLGVVSRARLQRDLDFRKISSFEVAGFTIGSIAAVILALAGLEARALVIGVLVAASTETVLMMLASRPPRPRVSLAAAREIGRFGVSASLAGLVNVTRRNVDYIILAARLPASQVGFYWRAFQLGASYQSKLTGIVQRLSFPLFSRARDAEDLAYFRARVMRSNILLLFPLLITFIVIAPEFVPWLYGSEWEPAVLPAQLLAVSGLALTVQAGTESIALAAGRPTALLIYNCAFLAAMAVAVLATTGGGLVAVCIAVSVVHVAFVAVGQITLVVRLAGIPMREIANDVWPGLAAGAGALVVGLTAAAALGGPISNGLILMLILGPLTLGAYACTVRVCFPHAWLEVSRVVRRVATSSRHPSSAESSKDTTPAVFQRT